MARSRVHWYGRAMLEAMERVGDEILTQAAFQAEGEAKVDAPVDTGFMRNAIYGIGATGNHRAEAEAGARAMADRTLAPVPPLEPHEAALHGAASYTIYQETKHGFMYNGVQRAIAAIRQIVANVGAGL